MATNALVCFEEFREGISVEEGIKPSEMLPHMLTIHLDPKKLLLKGNAEGWVKLGIQKYKYGWTAMWGEWDLGVAFRYMIMDKGVKVARGYDMWAKTHPEVFITWAQIRAGKEVFIPLVAEVLGEEGL